ncbi:HEPN domain-containing protein [Psychrobacter fozii]|uniref:Uncharacterized protein n=1 Tax=Psychrobacter fozii TaxID=198480 RepID=A0A2V4VCT2_9GAMM|nr:HEPN domain-containing protein [Psychrobacter fozii]PYE40048.1 hypothetical protein DFP82_1025 [Psychrobacter fozii]
MELEHSIFKRIENKREEFGLLLNAAIKDGLSKISDRVSSKKYISGYYNWPSISFRENGLPNLSSSNFQEIKEYRGCFGSKEGDIIASDINSFTDFLKFIKSNEELESRFIMQEWKKIEGKAFVNFIDVLIYNIITNGIERYIHVYDSFEYNENKVKDIIDEIQNFVFLGTLPVDIVIPILFVNFEFESYVLSEAIEVRRLVDKEHLARCNIISNNVSVHKSVLSSATHALVLKGWEVKNSDYDMDFNTLNDIRAYPTDRIDKFFASIRLVENVSTGYAQIFSLAKSWIGHCKADLPYAVGATTRSYPSNFEDYYWNIDTVPVVTNIKMDEISKIYSLLIDSEKNSIDLSVKRLNQCLVRDSEEDAVLDATIALEALLADDGNQEMTHKLAMRIGALVNLDDCFKKSPEQAFKDVKSIYAYRSAIVHGSKKLDKKRVIKLEGDKETTTHILAVEYLKFVLKVLLENPKYQDSKLIDSELLLGGKNV